MKVLFAGTPDFAVAPLQALIAAQHTIVGVFTQPDRKAGRGKKLTPPPVKVAAQAAGIPVFQPDSLKDQARIIEELDAQVMVVVAYGMLLPQSILDIPPLGCINIHASILPRWRGAAPIQRAIAAGDHETGVSIMKMELGLDTGPVYQTLTTPINADDTSSSLHDKLANLGAQGICTTLTQLAEQPNLLPTPQNHELANYAKKITKQEAIIDWRMNVSDLDQRIRAFIPWPICQTQHNGTRIRIWSASIAEKSGRVDEPGTIVACHDHSIDVACGEGVLSLTRLQRDGSKPLAIKEFSNGYALNKGDVLNGHQF